MHQTRILTGAETSPDADAPNPSCLVVGLGNCLLQDDGVGVHAVRCLMPDPPAGALVLEVGTDIFSALHWLERAPVVLAIDAMDGNLAPGTLYNCQASNVIADQPLVSLHEFSLLSALEFIDRNRRPSISVLGVQPAVIDYGTDLTPALKRVLPMVVSAARQITETLVTGRCPRRETPL